MVLPVEEGPPFPHLEQERPAYDIADDQQDRQEYWNWALGDLIKVILAFCIVKLLEFYTLQSLLLLFTMSPS